ncbi:hypothetical protein F4778DRAFT_777289 [Xylariomycetidae sp. FL2044]|nr:hypothetical protein F4778DRAFT_777289 [Xylariomycetidae sp. FL2044]
MQSLDHHQYKEYRKLLNRPPVDVKLPITEEDFLTMFVIGWRTNTQRRSDEGDGKRGLAGTVTLDQYNGENFCLPAFNIKIRYGSGTCVLFRAAELNHLVTQYEGTRMFFVGTNHENPRHRDARRRKTRNKDDTESKKRLRDSPSETEHNGEHESTTEHIRLPVPCDNKGEDELDPTIVYHNRYLAGRRALDWWSDSEDWDEDVEE